MDENERRRFESLESLRLAAYESFNDRRSYEWKLSLAIWTAQAVAVAGLLQPIKADEAFPLNRPWGWIGATIVGVALVSLHSLWSWRAARANDVDKGVSIHFRNAMQEAVSLPFDDAFKRKLKKLEESGKWSHITQVGITALLAGTWVGIILLRSA